ncbi:hypothetical protein LK533_15150 [Sphingomonas sp. PL-96]|uniref:hypothetical protein n=1 Tax=Sphingomonas sp. PL-96 TaxID=2887201 RepID=UPI001E3D799E|nr:hypothetical protein [Sphingomonas sp. PL-96]MCC2978000.1 hypothetical protein [Sphingomonas sp. PL-96]
MILALAMTLLALALAWVAWDGTASFWRELGDRRSVEVRTGVGAAAVGTVQLALLVGMLAHTSPKRQEGFFRAILWLSPLLVLFPLAILVATDIFLPRQGYHRCMPISGQRFLNLLWAPAGATCPHMITDVGQ